MSSPDGVIVPMIEELIRFWYDKQNSFQEVWERMEKKNKEFFANACVVACNKMCAQAEYLMPEINVASIVEQEEHVYQLFYYYSADDYKENDMDLVEGLLSTGVLEGPAEQWVAVRQLGILKCLERLMELYESIWTKGLEKKRESETEEIKQALLKKALKISERGNLCGSHLCTNEGKLMCGGCKQIKYCTSACQKAHWNLHRAPCKQYIEQQKDLETKEKKALEKKLADAKKRIKDKREENLGKRT